MCFGLVQIFLPMNFGKVNFFFPEQFTQPSSKWVVMKRNVISKKKKKRKSFERPHSSETFDPTHVVHRPS